jgi:hypothetical protein
VEPSADEQKVEDATVTEDLNVSVQTNEDGSLVVSANNDSILIAASKGTFAVPAEFKILVVDADVPATLLSPSFEVAVDQDPLLPLEITLLAQTSSIKNEKISVYVIGNFAQENRQNYVLAGNDIKVVALGDGTSQVSFNTTESHAVFTIVTGKDVPAPISPAPPPTSFVAQKNASKPYSSVDLSWAAGAPGATTGYVLAYLAGNTAPTNCSKGTVIGTGVLGASTKHTVSSLKAETTYSFRLCSVITVGATSLVTPGLTSSAKTDKAPPPPIPQPGSFSINPIGNTLNTTPIVTWGVSANATSYDMKVSSSGADCATPEQSFGAIAATSKQLTTLSEGIYYICVTAKNGKNKDATNSGLSFAIETAPTPGNGGTILASNPQDNTIDLDWTLATDVTSADNTLQYRLYGSASNNIDTVANIEANGFAIGSYQTNMDSLQATGLAPAATYYFNVIVKDGAGFKSAYTAVSETTTGVLSTVEFQAGTPSAKEDSGTGTMTVVASAAIFGSVNYAVTGGTATSPADFPTTSGTLTFANETTKTFTINPASDTLLEGPETIVVTLSAPSGATLGARSSQTFVIADSEVPTTPMHFLYRDNSGVSELHQYTGVWNGSNDWTWTENATVIASDTVWALGSINTAIDENNVIHTTYGRDSDAKYSSSADWTTESLINAGTASLPAGNSGTIAVFDDKIHAISSDVDDSGATSDELDHLYFNGAAWSEEQTICSDSGSANLSCWNPDAAVQVGGNLHSVFVNVDSHNMYYRKRTTVPIWAAAAQVTDIPGCTRSFLGSIAVKKSNGTVHLVSTCDNGTGQPCKAYYLDSSWTPTLLGQVSATSCTEDLRYSPEIRLDSADNVHILFVNTDDEKIIYANNTSGAFVTETAVDATVTLTNAHMEVDSLGFVHMVYERGDGAPRDLVYRLRSGPGFWVQDVIATGSSQDLSDLVLNGVMGKSYWSP